MPNDKIDKCPVCLDDGFLDVKYQMAREFYNVNCSRCGEFSISRPFAINLLNTTWTKRQRANASGYVSEHPNIELVTKHERILAELRTPSFHEKSDNLLHYLEEKTEYAGQEFDADIEGFVGMLISAAWALNHEELLEIQLYLIKQNFLDGLLIEEGGYKRPLTIKIAPAGWKHLEELRSVNPDSQQCFIAMCLQSSLNGVYYGAIKPAIEDAGYDPLRVDSVEHSGKIDDEIIRQIRRSRFMVVDFTKHRPNVYYEAGFAQGLGLPLIWTCHKNETDDLHFDIRQYNTIRWLEDDLPGFRQALARRIEAVLGRGAKPKKQ